MGYNVVIAEPFDDIERIVSLIKKHCEFIKVPFQESRLHSVVESFIDKDDKVCFLLLEDEKIVGYLFAIVHPHMITGELTGNELGFYCEVPGKGPLLIRAYEDFMSQAGVTTVTLGSHGTDRLDGYYARKGYTLTERIFTKCLS